MPRLDRSLAGRRASRKAKRVERILLHITQHAGNGWVLVGDAFGFIDPIYSTGVFLALRSGELAADCIIDGLSSGDVSATQLGQWTADFKRGIHLFHKLVDAFYTNEFSFARFLKVHPEHHSNLTDLLIGRAFYPEAGRIFEDLDPALEAARSAAMSPTHTGRP